MKKTGLKGGMWGAALAMAAMASPAMAIESATIGAQAPQSAVTAVQTSLVAQIATLQAALAKVTNCSNIRKFYSPADPRKDANGCVDLGANSGQYLNLYNNSGTDTWALYGNSTSGYGVYGASSNSWGGVFSGASGVYASNGSGIVTQVAAGGWGLYTNGYVNGSALCINGDCRTTWPSGHSWGGSFQTHPDWGCISSNPFTGGCSCEAGYSAYQSYFYQTYGKNWLQVTCYR